MLQNRPMDAYILSAILLLCGGDVLCQMIKNSNQHMLMKILFLNYILWWFISDYYYISNPTRSDSIYSWLLFPASITAHIPMLLSFLIYFKPAWIQNSIAISLALITLLVIKCFSVEFVHYFFITSLGLLQIGIYFLFKELNKRNKTLQIWSAFAPFGFIISLLLKWNFQENIIFNVNVMILSRVFDLVLFISLGLFAIYIDNQKLPEFTIKYILTESFHRKIHPPPHADNIETVLDTLADTDWSMENKFYILPKSYDISNKIINSILCTIKTLYFALHIVIYFIIMVIPLLWFIIKYQKQFGIEYTKFMRKCVNELNIYPQSSRSMLWEIGYYMAIFGEGIMTIYFRTIEVNDESNKVIKDTANKTETNRLDNDGEKEIVYNKSKKRYPFNSIVYEWCRGHAILNDTMSNLLSKDDKMNTFILEMDNGMVDYIIKHFSSNQTPNNLYIPSFSDPDHKTITSDDAYCYVLCTIYYKLFKKRLSPNDLDLFKECKDGNLCYGMIPNIISNVHEDNSLRKLYWKTVSKVRAILLLRNKNHTITRMIVKLAEKYELDNAYDSCINAFCAELLLVIIDTYTSLQKVLNYLNENQLKIEKFIAHPDVFVSQYIKLTGGNNARYCIESLLLQELVARLYQLQHIQLKFDNKPFINSFEFSDNKVIKYKHSKIAVQKAEMIHDSLDKHPRILLPQLREGVEEWNVQGHDNIPGFNNKLKYIDTTYPTELAKDTLFTDFDVVKLPRWDEDKERDFTKDTFLKLFAVEELFKIPVFPVIDDTTCFNNNEEMVEWREVNVTNPKPNVIWNDLVSDESMSLFAFESVGCFYTQKISEDELKDNTNTPKNAVYVNDFTFLHGYEVREGLHRYGAKAFFDNEYEIIAIYVSCLNEDKGKMVYRNDYLWEFSKYVWKTSIFVGITILDHAGTVHMIESNSLVTAVREHLNILHPLRRLLSIFTYRSISINYGLKASLLQENALIERISGFTFNSIQRACSDVYKNYTFLSLHQRIHSNMRDLPDNIYPINTDSKELYDTMRFLIEKYIDVYYKNEQEFKKDEHVVSFYKSLCKLLKYENKPLSYESFYHLIATLMTAVTGYHELVGTVIDIAIQNVQWLDTKIYKNRYDKTQQSKNEFALTAIVVMLTGLRCPSIINDFSHILIKDNRYIAAQNVFKMWQKKLHELSIAIDERNRNRRIPFNACNPKILECSVSI